MRRGAVAVVIVAIAVIVVWQARLQRGGRPSGAAQAIRALRAIASAQSEYAASVGHAGYAPSLAALAAPCAQSGRTYLSPDFASDPTLKAGYEVSLQPKPAARRVSTDCNGLPTYSGFYATAKPISMREEKQPAFAIDETGAVWIGPNGTPPTPPFRGPVVR